MNYRVLGKTGYKITEIGVGTWQLGGGWGQKFDDKLAEATLNKAIDLGFNFIDTADSYSDGLSENVVGRVVRSRKEKVYIASKIGRRLKPHNTEGYNEQNIRKFIEDSLKNLGVDKIDLIQLHCPTTEVYYRPQIFELMDRIVEEGKVAHYGVSVQQVEQALKAIEYPNVATVQIVFNMFRQRPANILFNEAKKRSVGIIARVPLASGLLSGKYSGETKFPDQDHRIEYKLGKSIDYDPYEYGMRGETFGGVNYSIGVNAVEDLKKILPEDKFAQYALKWILMFDAVSVTVVGAANAKHLESNYLASALPNLNDKQMRAIKAVYDKYFLKDIHHIW